MEAFERSRRLLGDEGLRTLAEARVAVFGLGGVGGYAAEALARAGVGFFTLADHDTVSEANINRQIAALRSTIGMLKTDVMRSRMLDINPGAVIETVPRFYPWAGGEFDASSCDYIVDAMDTVSSKTCLILAAARAGTPIVSCLGAGNRLDPSAFRLTDLRETSGCPLARAMRRDLRGRDTGRLAVVCSLEKPRKSSGGLGSVSFAPPVAGMIAAGAVVRGLLGIV